MKITDLEINGFGVWNGLKLEEFSDNLTVLYGGNEAGKTTLMQFVRGVCFGFDSQHLRRYFPPVHGGRPGGTLRIKGDQGTLQLERHLTTHDDGSSHEQFEIIDAHGRHQSEQVFSHLLSDIDEPTFVNIFVFGLRELQELATLNNTEASQHLYRLAGGFDRVSLMEVRRELAVSRRHFLDSKGAQSWIGKLSANRRKLIAQIEQLTSQTRQWARRESQKETIGRQMEGVQQDLERLRNEMTLVELTVTVRDPWKERSSIDEQLSKLVSHPNLPYRALEDYEEIQKKIQQCNASRRQLKHQWKKMTRRVQRVTLNKSLWRQRSRIETLQNQQAIFELLRSQTDRLRTELEHLKKRLSELSVTSVMVNIAEINNLSPQSIQKLQRLARGLRNAKRQLAIAKRRDKASLRQSNRQQDEIQRILDHRGDPNLSTAVENTGQFVDMLRQRIHTDERLQQLQRHRQHLEHESSDWLEKRVMTNRQILGTGTLFVAGSVVLMAALFGGISVLDISSTSRWLMGCFGIGMTFASAISKYCLEHNSERKYDDCRKQIRLIRSQFEPLNEQRNQLDDALPSGGGPFVMQLQAAERELESLQQLLPLDSDAATDNEQSPLGGTSLTSAARRFKKIRGRWQKSLSSLGLPDTITPQNLDEDPYVTNERHEITRQWEIKKSILEQKDLELSAFHERIRRILTDADIEPEQDEPCEQLEQLSHELTELESQVSQRRRIRHRARRLGKRYRDRTRILRRLRRRQRTLFAQADVKNEDEFRHVALETRETQHLQRQRKQLTRQIAVALGNQFSEEEVAENFIGNRENGLNRQLESMSDRRQTLEKQLNSLEEQSSQQHNNTTQLENDRRLGQLQVELSCVEVQLDQAVQRWKTLVVTSQLLDKVCANYEENRQPEALEIASHYLEELTTGKYLRIRTPLEREQLQVENAEGQWLEVESLSCGTREQLLLSLRLALVSILGRQGGSFPLILDDVLVNFDVERSKAAGQVLRKFSKSGCQMILFTCHEHILELFRALKVDVRTLPDHQELATCQTDQKSRKRRQKHHHKRKEPSINEELEISEDEPIEITDELKDEMTDFAADLPPTTTLQPTETIVENSAETTDWINDARIWDEESVWRGDPSHANSTTSSFSDWNVTPNSSLSSDNIDTLRDFLVRHTAHSAPAHHFKDLPPESDPAVSRSADDRHRKS